MSDDKESIVTKRSPWTCVEKVKAGNKSFYVNVICHSEPPKNAVELAGGVCEVQVTQAGPPENPSLRVLASGRALTADAKTPIRKLLTRMLGLDRDLAGFYELTRHDRVMAALAERFRGVSVFASTAINSAGRDGLLAGNAAQMVPQLVSVGATMVFSFGVSWILLKVIDAVIGLRVDEESEATGLDIAEHAETGYVL